MIYLTLFYEFFKTGLFAIGGGLATIPFLEDFASRTDLVSHADIANMIAISEATPGPIGVNSATYFGYLAGGPLGSVVATLALILPSILIILIVSRVLDRFRRNLWVDAALKGLRPASTGLIAAAGCSVLRLSLLDTELYAATGRLLDLFSWPAIVLAAVIWLLMKKFGGHPILYLAGSAVVGIVFKF